MDKIITNEILIKDICAFFAMDNDSQRNLLPVSMKKIFVEFDSGGMNTEYPIEIMLNKLMDISNRNFSDHEDIFIRFDLLLELKDFSEAFIYLVDRNFNYSFDFEKIIYVPMWNLLKRFCRELIMENHWEDFERFLKFDDYVYLV